MQISIEELGYLKDLFGDQGAKIADAIAQAIAPIATAVAQLVEQGKTIMGTIQDLEQKFSDYILKRDEIDAQKDAASAAKDATIADQVQKLADAAAKAGVDAQTIADLQAGIDDAIAKEQAALDLLNPPAPPVVVDTGGGTTGDTGGTGATGDTGGGTPA